MKHNAKHTDRKQYFAACLAVMVMLYLVGSLSASSEILRRAADNTAAGQWETALETLGPVQEPPDLRIETLRGLLQEHQALTQRQQQQRLEVFQETCKALENSELQISDETTLLRTMELFRTAWDNADASERKALLKRPIYATLRQTAQERFEADEMAGRWDAAWSKWLCWLTVFEPQAYKQTEEDLQQRRAIANALRKNPCDENDIPYAQVKSEAAAHIFKILQARYAEPVAFDHIAAKGLQQLALLPKVLSNSAVTFAVHPDPSGFAAWSDHIRQLQIGQLPASDTETAALLQTLTAINDTTLKLPDGVIIALFTDAALKALDPYTQAVWPEEVSRFEKSLTGQFGGVGIRIKKDGEKLVILSVIPDTPAAGTTLAADDVIVAVDNQPTRDMTTDCAVQRISGPVGTIVHLTIHRAGAETDQTIAVTRQKIVLPTIEGSQRADNGRNTGRWDYFLDARDRIGYLQLNGFTDKTAKQARHVLEQLEQNDVAGLIIDVRGNGGGLLSEATAFANLFVNDGLLLSSHGRQNSQNIWQATPSAVKRNYPLAILIDDGSASASEIVAGVLAARKPDQTILIGQRTYGKGTVQEVVDLGQGKLKLTTAGYQLPDGRPVQNRFKLQAQGRTDWGIAPDISIPLYAYEKSQVKKLQLERRKQLMAPSPPAGSELQNETLTHQMLTTDAQLSAALVVLKAKILAAE